MRIFVTPTFDRAAKKLHRLQKDRRRFRQHAVAAVVIDVAAIATIARKRVRRGHHGFGKAGHPVEQKM